MFLCWYYSFETQSQCETPICEERWEGICPLDDVKKQVYCVCVPFFNSPRVQGYCQQQPKAVNRSNLWGRNVYTFGKRCIRSNIVQLR